MRTKFSQYGETVLKFGEIAIKKIQTRSGNQAVNSLIQGTCATLAKRSILKLRQVIKDKQYRARFVFPCHDELVFSVHKDEALAFSKDLWYQMCETHKDIVSSLVLDAAVAIGKNYQVWDLEKNTKGQIELDECNKGIPFLPEERWGKKLNDEERQKVIDYLCAQP